MLLDEEDEGVVEMNDEDEYFMRSPSQIPRRPRGRPARGITGVDDNAPGGGASGPGMAASRPRAGGAGSRSEQGHIDSEAQEARHLFPRSLTAGYPVAVRARGVWIEDSTGKKYLDGSSGAVISSIGHGVKEIAAVMTPQAKRLEFAHSSEFVSRESMRLASRIAALCPGDLKKTGRVYLTSGGSEAVETALKLARQYHIEKGNPGKWKIISRWQSYHGNTMGALAVTGNVARRALYEPMFANMPHIPPCYCYRCPYELKYPSCKVACVEDLETAINQEGSDSVAAFIAEPVVGATLGAVPAVDEYFRRAREICTKHDILLIADEVMTGIGRTGRNFAIDHHGVVPDMIVMGKGLAGGYTPLAGVIARGFIVDAILAGRGYFEHGFTYSANPLSAAIGTAVLDYIVSKKLIPRAARMGRILEVKLQKLLRHRIVGDIRGRGMMWGIEIVTDRKSREPFPAAQRVSKRLYDACLAEGLIIYPGSGTREGRDGDHFIVAPPFIITPAEIDELLTRLDRAIANTTKTLD